MCVLTKLKRKEEGARSYETKCHAAFVIAKLDKIIPSCRVTLSCGSNEEMQYKMRNWVF